MLERLTSLPLGNGATRGNHPVRLDKGPRCTAHVRCWTLSMPEAICPFSSFRRARRVSFGRRAMNATRSSIEFPRSTSWRETKGALEPVAR